MTLFPEVLTTARLELRMPDPAVAPAVNEAIRESFETLSRWMDWADHIPSVEETHARLVRSRNRFMAHEDYGLHIFSRRPARYVGSAGLHSRLADETRREIGYWIRDSATGHGYAAEAVRAIAAAAFESLPLTALEIRASARNVASHRVAERAGFALDSVVSDGRVDPNGESSDTHVYILSRAVAEPVANDGS